MLNFEKHRNKFKELFPTYSEEQLKEIFELRVNFWK